MPSSQVHYSDAYVIGLAGALVAVLAGLWLAAAPFALAYQPDGAAWVDATHVGVWTGAGVALTGVLAAALFMVGLRVEAGAAPDAEPDDLDRAMAQVTAVLLDDLGDRRVAASPTAGREGSAP